MAQRKARRSASKKTKAAGKRPAPKRKAIRRPARKAAPVPNKRVAELEAENRRLRGELESLREDRIETGSPEPPESDEGTDSFE